MLILPGEYITCRVAPKMYTQDMCNYKASVYENTFHLQNAIESTDSLRTFLGGTLCI